MFTRDLVYTSHVICHAIALHDAVNNAMPIDAARQKVTEERKAVIGEEQAYTPSLLLDRSVFEFQYSAI